MFVLSMLDQLRGKPSVLFGIMEDDLPVILKFCFNKLLVCPVTSIGGESSLSLGTYIISG